jgi:hypothetical protein
VGIGTVVLGIVAGGEVLGVVAGDVVVEGAVVVVPVVPEGVLDAAPFVSMTSCGGVVVSRLPRAIFVVEVVVSAKL